MDKPDVDFIEGLSPAVSIDQKSTSRNPRSTVGTITEVYDYLRLLYARIGVPHCPICGDVIARQTPQQIVDQVLELPSGTRFQVLAPVVRERKGEYADLFRQLVAQGYSQGARRRGRPRARRRPGAQEAGEAHDRGGRRPADRQARVASTPHRLGRDRPRAWPAASSCWSSSTSTTRTPTASAPSASTWPAIATGSPSRSSSRARSRSTPRSAPARSAPGWAPGARSTPS